MTRLRAFLLRLGAAVLFLAVFFAAWSPLRSALAVHALGPLLGALTAAPVTVSASPPSVQVGEGSGAATYSVPGGLHFLVPGLFLVVLAPRRPYWLILWAALVALGVMAFAAFALGARGVAAGFIVAHFVEDYVVPPLSVGVALFLLARARHHPVFSLRGGVGTFDPRPPVSSLPPEGGGDGALPQPRPASKPITP